MPRERESITHKFSIAGHEGYITAGKYEDGSVGEIFLTDIGKEGSTLRGMMNAFATAISIGLQYGVPLEVFVRKFSYMRFDPEGITNNPEIPFAKSMPDYLMRWLASRFIDDPDELEDLGILTPEVRARREAQQSLPLGDAAEAEGNGSSDANGGNGNGHHEGNGSAADPVPPHRRADRHPAGDPGADAGPRPRPGLRPVRRHDAAHGLLLHLHELREQHRLRIDQSASARVAERGPQGGEVGRPEDHAVLCGDVDEIEVDPGPGDLAGQVRQHAGAVLDIDDDDLALAGDRDVGDRQRMLRGLGVRDEDVELGPLARPDACGGRDVHAGVADRGRHPRQRPGRVLDVDDQVDRHVPPCFLSLSARGTHTARVCSERRAHDRPRRSVHADARTHLSQGGDSLRRSRGIARGAGDEDARGREGARHRVLPFDHLGLCERDRAGDARRRRPPRWRAPIPRPGHGARGGALRSAQGHHRRSFNQAVLRAAGLDESQGIRVWTVIREVPDGNWGAAGQQVRYQQLVEAATAEREKAGAPA